MLKNPVGPKGLSIAQRLNAQSRSGEAGNRKTNADEVRTFKQRVADGMDPDEAREGTKISKRMVPDILGGRTWASVVVLVLMALGLMGNSCAQQRNITAVCQGVNYPWCQDVPRDYPCLCLSRPDAVTSAEAEELRYANDR